MLVLAPALAAGCAVVLKPSPAAVLDSYLLAEAVSDAGLPRGVVNILPAGPETGAHLVAHPGVDQVTFIGSTAVGRTLGQTCGRLLRPFTAVLSGKSSVIVLDDAELDLSVIGERLFTACVVNNGQASFAGTRVLAPRSRYDEVVELFTELARSLRVGPALDPQTRIGPLISARQRDRVESHIARGQGEGAVITTGGGRPDDLDRGWFIEPTVLAGVDGHGVVAQEAVFGPVLTITVYGDEDEAIRIANDSDYGLGGSVWTTDQERGRAVARRVHTGTVGINGYRPEPTAPFGGVRASGLGRVLGPEGLAGYQRPKSVYL